MTPFASFLYFEITLYFFIPLVIVGLLGFAKSARPWILTATLFMLVIQYWEIRNNVSHRYIRAFYEVILFWLFEWAIARGFLYFQSRKRTFFPFIISILAGLSPLLFAKLDTIFYHNQIDLFGFLGISYLTFRSLDVLFGIRDGLIKELPFREYAAFLLFFPTISAGPIDRYKRFIADYNNSRTKIMFLSDIDFAIKYLFRGFAYKFILGALIHQYWLTHVEHGRTFLSVISYMYAYSFYLFFDFAGYTAFAISMSYLFGIHTPENFTRPFFAKSIKEFWDRWHISLSSWLRDHVYMRFLITASKNKWFKNKFTASHIGFFLTMGLMGAWHGFELRYLVYGLYHAILLVTHDVFSRWNRTNKFLTGLKGEVISIVVTFHAVCIGFLIFSGRLF